MNNRKKTGGQKCFEHLKLRNYRGIIEVSLMGLGKINIVCGKNNSGKTSVMEAIFHRDHHVTGFSSYKDELKNAFHTRYPDANGYDSGFIDAFVQKNPILFTDEIELAIADKNIPDLPTANVHVSEIREVARRYFSEKAQLMPGIIFLAPKRNLQVNSSLVGAEIQPGGAGVLEHLFKCLNQPPKSNERKFFEEVTSAFTSISGGWKMQITLSSPTKLELMFSYLDDEWRPANNCGTGLQDLLIMLFFSLSKEYEIVLIEEPESHIHPEMQRKFCIFLASIEGKQFFLSTHSNIFLSSLVIDKIFFTEFDENIKIRDTTGTAVVLENLGYSVVDNLVSDMVVLVEGPYDRLVLEEYLFKMGVLANYNIKFFAVGGDIMDKQDLSLFKDNYHAVALIDSDPKSEKIRKTFEENCKDLGIPVHKLGRYSLENYYTVDALRVVFGAQIPSDFKEILPDKKLVDQIGIDVKRNSLKLAKAMRIEDLYGTDLYDEFLTNTILKTLKERN